MAGVQTKMDPCFYKMVLCYVASMCKFCANQNAPSFSFRCRWLGARGRPARPCERWASGSGRRRTRHASLYSRHCTSASTQPASERSEVLEQVRFVPNGTEMPPCKGASYRSTVRTWFSPKPLLLLHPGALLFFSAEKKRRGPNLGQDGKSLPC